MRITAEDRREKILMERLKDLRDIKADLSNKLDQVKAEVAMVESELAELMQDEEIEATARYPGLGHAKLWKPAVTARVVSGKEDEMVEYLKKINRLDMVRTGFVGVNDFVRDFLQEGKEPPPFVWYGFKESVRIYKERKSS